MLGPNALGVLLARADERALVIAAARRNGLQPIDLEAAPEARDLSFGAIDIGLPGTDGDAIVGLRGMTLIVSDRAWEPAWNREFSREDCPLILRVQDQAESGEEWVLPRPLALETVCAQLRQAAAASKAFATRHQAMVEELHRCRRIFDSVCNGITISDARAPDLPLVYVNPAFERMTGYSAREVLGRNCRFLQGADVDQPGLNEVRTAIREQGDLRVLLKNYRKDGTSFWNELSLSSIFDLEGHLAYFVGIQNDVTLQVESAQRLDHLASHDYLTGLANRALLMEQMGQALQRARRNGGNLAVLFFDIDNFKHVNDVLGHDAGDRLLQIVASRLRAETRGGEVVARWGGDEFVVVLEGFPDDRRPQGVMRRLTAKLNELVELLDQKLHPAASVGMAIFPQDGDTPEELLKVADLNMYAAKHTARQKRHKGSSLSTPV